MACGCWFSTDDFGWQRKSAHAKNKKKKRLRLSRSIVKVHLRTKVEKNSRKRWKQKANAKRETWRVVECLGRANEGPVPECESKRDEMTKGKRTETNESECKIKYIKPSTQINDTGYLRFDLNSRTNASVCFKRTNQSFIFFFLFFIFKAPTKYKIHIFINNFTLFVQMFEKSLENLIFAWFDVLLCSLNLFRIFFFKIFFSLQNGSLM